ncbi:Pycsar system effector family protein [Allosphingosinicella sp.]|uniref:Pycsar system effector family protein n=1 Tax=Allosphingosinicella sp. TaxID=2823234 RepID=UPI002FC21553
MDDQPPESSRFPPNAVHLVRTTQMIHVQLSAMADQKASILMAATFVIFTITIGQARGAVVPIPLLILGASAFFSAVCAVLAVLPATHYKRRGGLNLLFFGSFTQLEEDDYLEQITERLKTDEGIYLTMARDIYQNGVVLARKKYRLLGYAYRIFLVGLVASFIAFIIQYGRHSL